MIPLLLQPSQRQTRFYQLLTKKTLVKLRYLAAKFNSKWHPQQSVSAIKVTSAFLENSKRNEIQDNHDHLD